MTSTIIAAKLLILFLLVAAMYLFVRVMQSYEVPKKLMEKMDEMERQKLTGAYKMGLFQKYLDRLEQQLIRAGIKRYLPRAGVEIYFLFNVLEFTLIFCLIGDGILIPLFMAGLAVYLNQLILDILCFRNKKITEKHLLEFLNLISDYSLSESEITMIFYRCGLVLPNPLREALTKCHFSARSTGNTGQALYELRRSNDHFLFREIVLLLELCSQSDSDYQKVVNGCREMVSTYLKEERQKASVVKSLAGEAALMSGVALYGISTMLREFAGEVGFGDNAFDFFLHNTAGRICLILYGGLFFVMIQVILRFSKR